MIEGSDDQRQKFYDALVEAGALTFMAEKIALAIIPLEDDRPMAPELESEVVGVQRRFATEYAEPLLAELHGPKVEASILELTVYANTTLATYRDLSQEHGDAWYYAQYQAGLESFSGSPVTYAEAERLAVQAALDVTDSSALQEDESLTMSFQQVGLSRSEARVAEFHLRVMADLPASYESSGPSDPSFLRTKDGTVLFRFQMLTLKGNFVQMYEIDSRGRYRDIVDREMKRYHELYGLGEPLTKVRRGQWTQNGWRGPIPGEEFEKVGMPPS